MTPTPTATQHAAMSALTPPRPVPAGEPPGLARSLPRDYGASLRDLSSVAPRSPPRRPRALGVRRDHLGGSWDQLDTPRAPLPHLRASWDHLGPTWGDAPGGEQPRGVDALLTHTLRPSRHEAAAARAAAAAAREGGVEDGVAEMASPRDSVAGAKGLLNAPGQNNCFLNSAVQVSVPGDDGGGGVDTGGG